jgi:hypothetical protein
MWDGYVEQRIVAWDVLRWVEAIGLLKGGPAHLRPVNSNAYLCALSCTARCWSSFEDEAVADEELRQKQIKAGLATKDSPLDELYDAGQGEPYARRCLLDASSPGSAHLLHRCPRLKITRVQQQLMHLHMWWYVGSVGGPVPALALAAAA